MNLEDRLRAFLNKARSGAPPDVPDWPSFRVRAHRRLLARRIVALSAGAAIVAGGVFGAGALVGEGDRSRPPVDTPTVAPTPNATDDDTELSSECGEASPFETDELGTVAYERSGSLHLVRVSSGDDQTLVEEGVVADDAHPIRWSPDGRWIAFGPGDLIAATEGSVCRPLGIRTFGLMWAPTGESFVAQTESGALWQGEPSGDERRLLPPDWGVHGYVFDPSGRFLAVGRFQRKGENVKAAGIWMIDLQTGSAAEVLSLPPEGAAPRVATWSPDGQWILYWETFGLLASLNADGGPLKAVPVSGGAPVTVVDGMLFNPGFITWCDDTLVATAGGGREVTLGKRLVTASSPDWNAAEIGRPPEENVFWPDCSSDGTWVTATATPNRLEPRIGTLERGVIFFPLDDPSTQGGFSVYDADMSAEFSRWSANHPGGHTTMLFMARAPRGDGLVEILLQQGERQVKLAEVGSVGNYYGAYAYDSILDWYQP